MKALVYRGPGVLVVEDRVEPSPGTGEVVVAVRAAGICGSDIHGAAGRTGRRTPGLVMGHELAGVVVAQGAGVDRPRRGARVAVYPMLACGECDPCRAGARQRCERRRVIGVDLPGGYAEYVAVPAANCWQLRRGTTLAQGALAEPLAVGLHATSVAGVRRGDTVAVLGAGAIGLCVLLACQRRGARRVFVTDLVPERLALAEALGGIPGSAAGDDVADRIAPAAGPLTRVIDAVGRSETVRTALAIAAAGGRVAVVGMDSPQVELPLFELVVGERTLAGVYAYTPREYARAVRLINTRRVDVTPLIGRTCALGDLPDLFVRLQRGEVAAPRVVADIGGGPA